MDQQWWQSFCLILSGIVAITPVIAVAQNEPLSKGYSDSFQTGDIPKPNAPDLDPDASDDMVLAPVRSPETNPMNRLMDHDGPDNFLVGASGALVTPYQLNLALETVLWHNFGISINYGNFTKSMNSVDVAMNHFDIRGRWFPWSGSFFLGLGMGQQQLTGDLDRTVVGPTSKSSIAMHGKLVGKSKYVLPNLGWFSIWDSGFTIGCDVGYLLPFQATSDFSYSFSNTSADSSSALQGTSEFQKMQSDLEGSAKKRSSTGTFYATFIRLGWMF